MENIVYLKICGDMHPMRYTLIKVETLNVYGSGRPGWGIKFQSDSERCLISDHFEWFETSEFDRNNRIESLLKTSK